MIKLFRDHLLFMFKLAIKGLILSLTALLVSANIAYAQHESPAFNVRHYGSFKKGLFAHKLAGSVDLLNALTGPHIYGLGMIANAEGVITVLDGHVWLNYGEDGIDVTRSMIPEGEEAALLITAQVDKWRKIAAPEDMSEHQLYAFIRRQAGNLGIDTRMPFPFLIEGRVKNLVWHVLDGIYVSTSKSRDRLFLRKLVEYKDSTEATLIGFYPGRLKNEFSYPGELWHVHALFRGEQEEITGHASTFVVSKGAQIELPLK